MNQFGEKMLLIKISKCQIVKLFVMDSTFDRNTSLLPIEFASFCGVEAPIFETILCVDSVSGVGGTRVTRACTGNVSLFTF